MSKSNLSAEKVKQVSLLLSRTLADMPTPPTALEGFLAVLEFAAVIGNNMTPGANGPMSKKIFLKIAEKCWDETEAMMAALAQLEQAAEDKKLRGQS